MEQFYKRLNFTPQDVAEIRAINPHTGEIKVGFFDNEEDFVRACAEMNRKYQLYAGRNPRPRRLFSRAPNQMKEGIRAASDEDIEKITAIAIDIDPIRPAHTASTDDELQQAIEVGKKIAAEYPNSSVDMTGNGAAVWMVLDEPIENSDEIKRKLGLFEETIRQKYSTAKIKIDSIHNQSRINKIIGTRSIKGKDTKNRPHRDTQFISYSTAPVAGLAAKIKGTPVEEPFRKCEVMERIRTNAVANNHLSHYERMVLCNCLIHYGDRGKQTIHT
jgi:hypothetical protein